MLVLTRKIGEKVLIGNGITLTVVAVSGNKVRIGIKAPKHIPILRSELGSWLNSQVDSDESLKLSVKTNVYCSEAVPQM